MSLKTNNEQRITNNDPPLNFAIIGCGVIGPVHAEAIASLPDARLVAVADPVAERAEKLAQRFGVRAYSDFSRMLASEELDVVNVCTPSGMHGEHAIAVMRSGRHAIVEKPLEVTLPAIDEILWVQREMGVKLAVISQRRFDPASQQLRRLVEEGALGRVAIASAQLLWWRSQAYYDSSAWRGTWDLDGGGVLMNQTIHSIDLLLWLAGPVHSVRAYIGTLAHRMETEDAAVAALTFESGALGAIVATTAAYPGVVTRLELFGDRGSAIIENDRLVYLRLARDDTEEAPAYGAAPMAREMAGGGTAQDPAAVSTNTHAAQIADMIRAIREGGEPLVNGQVARQPVALIEAIYRSARSGEEVLLP